jgi:hypothetical protein
VPLWPTPKPAVLAAITVLAAAIDDVDISSDMPVHRPETFIRVSRIGGRMPDPSTDNARILVEVFGVTTAVVEDLCNQARAALRNASSTTVLSDVFIRSWDNEQGPVELQHPQVLDRERWQFHGDLLVKAN